jgi:hypothetical protein
MNLYILYDRIYEFAHTNMFSLDKLLFRLYESVYFCTNNLVGGCYLFYHSTNWYISICLKVSSHSTNSYILIRIKVSYDFICMNLYKLYDRNDEFAHRNMFSVVKLLFRVYKSVYFLP